jgi:RNA-binding protein
MDAEEARKLRDKARSLEPLVRIGKNGITDAMVVHIRRMLLKRRLVKVRFLQSFMEENDIKEVASTLSRLTGSVLIDRTGFVVVLYREQGQ